MHLPLRLTEQTEHTEQSPRLCGHSSAEPVSSLAKVVKSISLEIEIINFLSANVLPS